MDLEFNSLKELYDRIKPALTSKKSEMKKYGFYYVKEADIWNYLASKKWLNSKDLSLSEMVDDIFNSNPDDINNYVVKKISEENRQPYFDE